MKVWRIIRAGLFILFTIVCLIVGFIDFKYGGASNKAMYISFVIGVILVVASAFQQLGINNGTDGGKAAFITALYVVLVPIYALALKKKAALNVWISIGIAVIGFYLLCIKEDLTVAPSDLLVIASSMIFPIHILSGLAGAVSHRVPPFYHRSLGLLKF